MKTFTLLTLSLLCTIKSFAQIPPPPDPNLFAHWQFDNTLDDYTFHGYNLSHDQGPGYAVTFVAGRDSLPNKAIQLGSQYALHVFNPQDDFFKKSIQIDTAGKSFSVAAWLTQNTGGYLVGNRNLKTLDDSILIKNWGQFSIHIRYPKKVQVQLVDTAGNIQTFETDSIHAMQKWYHLACVFDKDKDSLLIYINAQRYYAYKLVPLQQEGGVLCVGGMYKFDTLTLNGWGGSSWYFTNSFYGKVDDMKIYKRKLSDSEVNELFVNDYINGIGGPDAADKFEGKIYPNPVAGSLTIESPEPVESIKVFSALGELVKEQKINAVKATIDFKGLSAGTYLLQLNTGKGTYLQKIIRE